MESNDSWLKKRKFMVTLEDPGNKWNPFSSKKKYSVGVTALCADQALCDARHIMGSSFHGKRLKCLSIEAKAYEEPKPLTDIEYMQFMDRMFIAGDHKPWEDKYYLKEQGITA